MNINPSVLEHGLNQAVQIGSSLILTCQTAAGLLANGKQKHFVLKTWPKTPTSLEVLTKKCDSGPCWHLRGYKLADQGICAGSEFRVCTAVFQDCAQLGDG